MVFRFSFLLMLMFVVQSAYSQYGGNKRKLFNSYVVVNDGLEQTKSNIQKENQRMYYKLTQAYQEKGDSIKAAWDSSQVLRNETVEIIDYINNLKVLLIAKSEGKARHEVVANDTIISIKNLTNFDDYFTPTSILIGENRWEKLEGPYSATELKTKLQKHKRLIIRLLDQQMKDSPKPSIPLEDYQSWTKSDSWEMASFYNTPLAGVITYLSKLQVDVLLAESMLLNHYLLISTK
ncbi:MAG: hypothetical protein ACK4K0_11380 [Flavobacteriales bacterium]